MIIGNPPYSAKQESTNDNNQNLKYENLDQKIGNTYAKFSKATFTRNLYASEIRAIKWASERIKNKGIVCYVVNGAFIDSNYGDGLRKCLVDEFTSIYCFNLRGDQRTSGEQSRKEGGKIFGSGSRATIAIILLIKNPHKKPENKVFYYDIGDYLTREQKLNIIQNFGDISTIKWQEINPNENHDWINQRHNDFESFISLGDKKDTTTKTIFDVYSMGVKTNRDTWVYNFNSEELSQNMMRMIDFYNEQVTEYALLSSKPDIAKFINTDPKKIKWTEDLIKAAAQGILYTFDSDCLTRSIYRPFCKQSQIPLETYEYIVNGKSALEWIMERYKVTKDKDSGIINDPNHWSENPRYIVDLVKRIVRVSLETVRIVKSLPALNEIV